MQTLNIPNELKSQSSLQQKSFFSIFVHANIPETAKKDQ